MKKPIRIAFAMTKGGAGKTTSAAAFATELAAQGNRVLLVDTDTQALVRHALGADDSVYGLYDLADGVPFQDVVYRFTDHPGERPPRPNLDVIISTGNLHKLSLAWTLTEADREGQFADLMEEVEEEVEYDYILVDTSPTEGMININVFFYVHHILVPVVVSPFHIFGLRDFIEVIERTKKRKAKRRDSELDIRWVLPTRYNRRIRTNAMLLEEITDIAGEQLPGATLLDAIPQCARTEECALKGESILEYDRRSRGGLAYAKAVMEVSNYAGRKDRRLAKTN